MEKNVGLCTSLRAFGGLGSLLRPKVTERHVGILRANYIAG